MQDSNKKSGRSSRTAILLDLAPPRRPVLEVGIRPVVDWPPLLTSQLEGVVFGLGSKHPVKVGDHLKRRSEPTDEHPRAKYIALCMQEIAKLTKSRNPSSESAY